MEVGESAHEVCFGHLGLHCCRVVGWTFVLVVDGGVAICDGGVKRIPDDTIDTGFGVPFEVVDTLLPVSAGGATVLPEVAHLHHRDAILLAVHVVHVLVAGIDQSVETGYSSIDNVLVELRLVFLVDVTCRQGGEQSSNS